MKGLIVFVNFFLILCGIFGKCYPLACRYPNEEYAVDAKRPQNTCEYYGCYDQFACRGSSETGDCYCKKGFARIFASGPCISIRHPCCQRKLPHTPAVCQNRENEVWREYAGSRQCDNTCANYNYDCGSIFSYVPIWKPWCDCIENYARLPNGKCVPVSDPRCSMLFKPSAGS